MLPRLAHSAKYAAITAFKDVHVPAGSLVVLDIDDTVLYFKELGRQWWAKREREWTATHGYAHAREQVMREWIDGAHVYKPILTDEEFPKFMCRALDVGAHIVFLTARSADLRALTELHMASCGIEVEPEQLYFSREKGAALKQIVRNKGFSKVVFIDDMTHNIESVLAEVCDVAEVDAYHFHKYE
jgi:hypothetical protein